MAEFVAAVGGWCALAAPTRAQENYEIQVYGSAPVETGHTMVELHSNFTFGGSHRTTDGTSPTNHQLHETVEVTHGFAEWFETGVYLFTSAQNGSGIDWVGDHLRPRVSVPKSWGWPVGLSLSQEIGYQRRQYSEDTWTYELRPIIDKAWERWYVSVNPVVEKALHGRSTGEGFVFAPNAKASVEITQTIAAGVEYYGSLGPVSGFYAAAQQQQQIFPVIDLNVSPKWEINMGVGVGLTRSTDDVIPKLILGYRFDF